MATAVGHAVAMRRLERGLSQDDLASQIRNFGLNWTRATVASLEIGRRRDPTLRELCVLSLVLYSDIVSLLPTGDTWVEVTPSFELRAHALVDVVVGARTMNELHPGEDHRGGRRRAPGTKGSWEAEVADRIGLIREQIIRIWPGPDSPAYRAIITSAWEESRSEAVQGAARSLGVDAGVLGVAAHKLWGRGFLAERERRVKERAGRVSRQGLRALRGHVTRQLLEEIQPLIAAVVTTPRRRHRRKVQRRKR